VLRWWASTRSIDDTESGGSGLRTRAARRRHVVDLTNLAALPPRGARFTATPPAIEGSHLPGSCVAELPAIGTPAGLDPVASLLPAGRYWLKPQSNNPIA
jgi:hypothetical protein